MRAVLAAALLATAVVAGCDRIQQQFGDRSSDRVRLSLSLEAPSTLDWGEESTIRLALANQGDTASTGVRAELFIPAWLEFGPVEPEGIEMTVRQEGERTRLSYRLTDPALPAGEARTIVQRVRVPPAPPAGLATVPGETTAAPADVPAAEERAPGAVQPPGATRQPAPPVGPDGQRRTGEAPGVVPEDRLLRARLVTEQGSVLGAEVTTTLPFRGAPPLEHPAPEDPAVERDAVSRDRVGPVRLRMTRAELREAVPDARDTTWTQEGMTERGLTVPLREGQPVVAVLDDDRVHRIIVRDRAIRTAEGLGVGSRLDELREAYGQACADATEDGRAVVWFARAPGVSFALDADPQRDPERLPGSATVTELWVREGVDTC